MDQKTYLFNIRHIVLNNMSVNFGGGAGGGGTTVTVNVVNSGATIFISGQCVCISGQPVSVSGNFVNTSISGNVVQASVTANVSGQAVFLGSGSGTGIEWFTCNHIDLR